MAKRPAKLTVAECIAWLEYIRGAFLKEDMLPLETTIAYLKKLSYLAATAPRTGLAAPSQLADQDDTE